MAQRQIQWGTITLRLDNETFQHAFTQGRSMYFDDSVFDIPHVACHMNTLDAVGSELDEDGKGGYRFDRMAFNGPFDLLGFFPGDMSGPVLAESLEEHEERMKHAVILPEPSSATGIALWASYQHRMMRDGNASRPFFKRAAVQLTHMIRARV